MSEVTRILSQIQSGDPTATDQLLALVYGKLRNLATARLAQDSPRPKLQATALIHEAYLQLFGNSGTDSPRSAESDHRGLFFAAAAEAMRRIMVENARRKASLKRGGVWERRLLENLTQDPEADSEQILDIDEALQKLAEAEPQAAELVKLRFFAGLTMDEAASCLGMSSPTADNTWSYAKTWLHRVIEEAQISSQLIVEWFDDLPQLSLAFHAFQEPIMEMTISQADGYVLAKTSGPIDDSADPLFQEHLLPIVSRTGAHVVIDLSSSSRINSRGLSTLVTLVARSNTSGSRVVLCGVCPFVTGVFSVTKLDQFFELAANETDAASRTKERSKTNKAAGNIG